MGRAYSQDLRKKMVELYESGNSMKGVLRILKLAPRTVKITAWYIGTSI